jgi:hypothetical protein
MKVSIVSKLGSALFLAIMLLIISGVFSFQTTFAAPTNHFKVARTKANNTIPASAPTLPSISCPQPNRLEDVSKLTLKERIDQGYPIPFNGKTDPTVDKIIHDRGKHFCSDTDVPRIAHSSIANHAEYNSRNYSGNFADGGLNYTYAQAFFTESCITFGTNDHYATWAGIGGYNNENLVQAGAEGDNWSLTSHDYVAWVENVDAGYDVNVFTINCGDQILSEIGGGNCMLVIDETSGNSSGWRCVGQAPGSSTAECIVEAPKINGSIAELSNYGSQLIDGCEVEANSGETEGIQLVPHDYNNMYNGSTLLSSTGSIANEDRFTMTWHNYS